VKRHQAISSHAARTNLAIAAFWPISEKRALCA
jgi:hypothetical protein